jgi:polysaccharide pyruvyl transferase WcaK-like protein/peptidoglycan/xylan/chitin deacetylase (PgdA/CDA1 family)
MPTTSAPGAAPAAAAPSWVVRAVAAAASQPPLPGARAAIAVTPHDLPQEVAALLAGCARREESGDGGPTAAQELLAAFGARRMREALAVYADCFRHSAVPGRLAEEITEVAQIAAGVLVVEREPLDVDPCSLLARAGSRATPARRSDGADGTLLEVTVAAPAPAAPPSAPPLVVLAYHRVDPHPGEDPFRISVARDTFERHLEALAARFRLVGPDGLQGPVPEDRPALLLTFDDAYETVYRHAFPVLARRRVPAVVFAATGYVGSGRPFWWERLARWRRLAGLPAGERDRLQRELRHLPAAERDARLDAMGAPPEDAIGPEGRAATWEMLAEMQASGLVEVGGHTRWHPSLGLLDQAEAAAEVRGAIDDIEAELGLRPRLFAFPHGSPDDVSPAAVAALAERGIEHAFTTSAGVLAPGAHSPGSPAALTLPRLLVPGDLPAAALVRRIEALLPSEWRDRGRTRRRIAVLSGISASNLGDDAMLVATVRALGRLDPEAEITVLAEDPSRCGPVAAQIGAEIVTSLQPAVQRLLAGLGPGEDAAAAVLALARRLVEGRDAVLGGAPVHGLTEAEVDGLRVLMGADGVIDCGGANLSLHWRSYLYEKCLDYLVAAKPLAVTGQGVDPLDRPEDVALLRLALAVASEVTVREPVTLDYLESIGCAAALRVTGDDAVDLEPAAPVRRDALLRAAGLAPGRPYLAVQFRHYLDYEGEQAIGAVARRVDAATRATGLPAVGVPMHFGDCDEREHLRALAARLERPDRFHLVAAPLAPNEAKALFASAAAALGISYHSAVFALTAGTPYVGLPRGSHYRQKLEGLARLFGFPEVAAPLDEVSAEEVGRRLADLLARREEVSAHLGRRTAAIREEVEASRRRFLARVPRPGRGGDPAVPVGRLDWGGLRRLAPVSRQWGFDRGRPVDRFYIERFLEEHAGLVRGRVCELLSDEYARRFGGDRLTRVDVLDIDPANTRATIVDDLTAPARIPEGAFDCFVLTQVLPYIYDCGAALATAYRSLAPGGALLVTVPSVIKYHREPEDHWRFTTDSLARLVRDHCPDAEREVRSHGNLLACVAFLHGLAAEELTEAELRAEDPEFPLVVTACVRRPLAPPP